MPSRGASLSFEWNQSGFRGVQCIGIACLGQCQVELGQGFYSPGQLFGQASHQDRQLGQNALDLFLLLDLELTQAIGHLYDRQGFDKESGTAGRRVMNNARDPPLEVGLDGDHITPTSLRDQRFLQIAGVAGIGNDPVQFVQQALVRCAQLTANPGQLFAGVIHHLALIADASTDFVSQTLTGLDARRHVSQQGHLSMEACQRALHTPSDAQCPQDVQEIGRLQDRAPRGVLGQRPYIVCPS